MGYMVDHKISSQVSLWVKLEDKANCVEQE